MHSERMAMATPTGCHSIDGLAKFSTNHLVTWQRPTPARSIGGGS